MHIGGNYVLLPLLTIVLFTCNIKMMNIPYENALADQAASFKNICEVSDTLSHVLFILFYVVAGLTYVAVFYFLVSTFMLL